MSDPAPQYARRTTMESRRAYDLALQATTLASIGYHVFPCQPGQKTPLARLAPHGCHDASSDPSRVARWWSQEPHANIGIAAGHGNLLIIDLDPEHGGYQTARELRDDLPLTLAVMTGSGGMHLYYLAPEPKNSAGKLGPGIDTRGAGGYVVAPPSVHPNGNHYQWIKRPGRPRRPIPAAPGLVQRLATRAPEPLPHPVTARPILPPRRPPTGPRLPKGPAANSTEYADTTITGLERDLLEAQPGRRNYLLHRASRRIAQLYAANHLQDPSEAVIRIRDAAIQSGLTPKEIVPTIKSGYDYGLVNLPQTPFPATTIIVPTPHDHT